MRERTGGALLSGSDNGGVFWDTPADNLMVWLRKVGHSPYGIGLDAFVLLVGGCLRDMEEIADETEKECFESETRTED